MVKVSVIMPVYNEEKYIREALESFEKQTLKEKELICIDDGSKDKSIDIIKEYSDKYHNIQLLIQPRSGAGPARNLGIRKAAGEYVCFLDADDLFIENTSLQQLYECAAYYDENICAGLQQTFSEGNVIKNKILRNYLESRSMTVISYADFQYDYGYQNYLFKKVFLEKNNLSFPSFLRYQDPPFLVQALYCAEHFRVLSVEFYGYRYGYKKILYTTEKVNDLFRGLSFNLMFAWQKGLTNLFELTLKRINSDYFKILYDGLDGQNMELLELMLIAEKAVRQAGSEYKIEPLWALFFQKNTAESYQKSTEIKKIKKFLTGVERIVLYGAGYMGRRCQNILENIQEPVEYLWVDKYKEGEVYEGAKIHGINEITAYQYDRILIAVEDEWTKCSIEKELVSMGIDARNIAGWRAVMT